MKKNILIFTIVSVLFLAFSALGEVVEDLDALQFPKLNDIPEVDVRTETLDNGIRLYMAEDHSLPRFQLRVSINGGSYIEPADKTGLVFVLGQVLRTGGTGKWTGDELDEMLEAVGASVETYGGFTNCGATVRTLSDYTDLGLAVLAEILLHPTFDEDKIELAKIQERTGISRRNDDAAGIANREFDRLIYGAESVYGRNTEYKTIENITRDDLIAFHGTYFKPENVQIAIIGDFDRKEIVKKLKQTLGGWKPGTTPVPALPEVNYEYTSKVNYVNKSDVNQSNVLIGHIGGRTQDEDYADLVIMNSIFGGGFGNRMFNAVRSKEGLAYSARGRYTTNFAYPGVFRSSCATKSESTGKAIKEIIKVIRSMQTEPPSEEELSRAKESYLNSFVFQFDSKAEVVNRMMTYDFFGLPQDFLQQLKNKIENVTADDVVAAAKKHLRPDKLQILVVGKGEDFDMPLADLGFGAVSDIDITIPPAHEEGELDMSPEKLAAGKELLAKAIQAHGGLDNFQKVTSVHRKGSLTIIAPQGSFALNMVSYEVFPDKSYQEVVTPMGSMYDVRDGGLGWKTDQRTFEVVDKSEEDLLENAENNLRDILFLFRTSDDPAYQAVFDGTGDANGTEVALVAIVGSGGEVACRLGLNPATGELVSKHFIDETPAGEGMVTEVYTGFTETNGLKLPSSSQQFLSGQKVFETAVTEMVINPVIPEGIFGRPEK